MYSISEYMPDQQLIWWLHYNGLHIGNLYLTREEADKIVNKLNTHPNTD